MKFNDIDPKLCNYCGACVGICPVNAIGASRGRMKLVGKCTSCGLCYENCPGMGVPLRELSRRFLGEGGQGNLGFYRSVHIAHSLDREIREGGSSGGVVTALLIYALKKGLVDWIVVVAMDERNPWRCSVRIVNKRGDVIRAAGSKYSILDVCSVLSEVSKRKGKFALVGLPCHIHAIRKLQANGWKHAKRIRLLIGLFCGFNMSPEGTEYIVRKLGLKPGDVKNLEYRGGGWPGGFIVKIVSGGSRFVPKSYYNLLMPMYVPDRCLACPDLTAELADISIGDAWGHRNCSSVILRSNTGSRVFRQAVRDGCIASRKADAETIRRSHSHLLKYKKRGVFVRMGLMGLRPAYDIKAPVIGRMEYAREYIFFQLIMLLKKRPIRRLLSIFPVRLLGILASAARGLMK